MNNEFDLNTLDVQGVTEVDLFAESVEDRLNATASGSLSTLGTMSTKGTICTIGSICTKSCEVLETGVDALIGASVAE